MRWTILPARAGCRQHGRRDLPGLSLAAAVDAVATGGSRQPDAAAKPARPGAGHGPAPA